MKKTIKEIILFMILLFIIIEAVKIITFQNKIYYQIDNYQITEKLEKNRYDYVISKDNQTFTYTLIKNLKKDQKLITKIKTLKEDDITCIIPFYKEKIENNYYCTLENQQVSIDYLLKNKKESFTKILEKGEKYKINLPNSTNLKTKYQSLEVYNENILPNHIYYLWNYKKLYVLEQNNNKDYSVLDFDLYDNILACTVEDNYVLLDNSSIRGIEKIYLYQAKKKKIKEIKIKGKLAKDSYINGVVGADIYLTDRKNEKEYILDFNTGKLIEIDENQSKYIIYHNNKKTYLSKKKFFSKDQFFTNSQIDNYTYFQEENKIYKYLEDKMNSILLLDLEGMQEWYIKGNEILLIKEDTVYSYNDQKGLRKIVESNELNYNYKNIYQLGEKS